MTKMIFIKDGKKSATPIFNADEIRYIEINDEHIPLDIGLDELIEFDKKGFGRAGSCGIITNYKFTSWATGPLKEKHENDADFSDED